MSLRGRIAIVGAADTKVGVVPDMSPTELCVNAALLALQDADLDKSAIDGLITCNSFAEPIMYHAEAIAEYLQIFPRYCVTANTGGGTTLAVIQQAAAAMEAGLANTVLISMADSLRSSMTREQSMRTQASTGHPQFEQPYGLSVPAYYALIGQAHMAEFGTTREQFAEVAVSCRVHASRNLHAQKRELISVSDVIASRPIAEPLHLLDCSLVSDGGAALIITTSERAADYPHAPVYLLGIGEGHSHEHISQAASLTTSAAVESGCRAYEMAGLTASDMDFAQLYDCFTPTVLVELEDLGFCSKGEGGDYLQSGATYPGGALPVNTHGGMLSHCHPGNPGSMFALTETVWQLRHQAEERQVENAAVGLVHAQGGIMSSHATAIFARERG
ncbi:MAG: thiolase family protein [Pseudomonadales bacterium]|nr:thiolase family protein [Pseudomonadales bacterium]